jgi:hypothetical protein
LEARGLEVGAIASLQTVHDLGAAWYATRCDRDWERADAIRTAAIFTQHGLVGEFWSLG